MDTEDPKPVLFVPNTDVGGKGKPTVAKKTVERDASILSVPGSDLLTDAEIAEIRANAETKAKQTIKDAAKKELSDKFDKLELQRTDPNEELETVMIDVPGFAAINKNGTGVMVNGVMYQHGVTYTLPRRQAQSIKDIMAQAWAHEGETGGSSRDIYRRPKNSILSPRDVGASGNLMRV